MVHCLAKAAAKCAKVTKTADKITMYTYTYTPKLGNIGTLTPGLKGELPVREVSKL